MNEDDNTAQLRICPNCETPQTRSDIYCKHCGARLAPIESAAMPPISFGWMLLTLPLTAIVGLGSCAAALAIGAGAVMLNWKIVAISVGALLLCVTIALLLKPRISQ